MLVKVNQKEYNVPENWFWHEYNQKGWEPKTYEIFKRYLRADKEYIDIGAFIGPTVLYAHEIGVKTIHAVEPNLLSHELLLDLKRMNDIPGYKMFVYNLCITDKSFEEVSFGPTNGNDTSSASSLRGNSWKVKTFTLLDFIKYGRIDNFNFIKIDIEGAEELIIKDLIELSKRKDLYIYLSLHPEFWNNRLDVTVDIIKAYSMYDVFDSDDNELRKSELMYRCLSLEKAPSWGTPMGNYFEILLKSKN